MYIFGQLFNVLIINVLMCFHITYLQTTKNETPANKTPISPGALAQLPMGLKPPGACGILLPVAEATGNEASGK